jgi:hypothetical protein
VRRRDELLHLLASEDINCSKVALGVTVFAGLGGGDLDDLRAYGRISTIALHVKTLRQRRARSLMSIIQTMYPYANEVVLGGACFARSIRT